MANSTEEAKANLEAAKNAFMQLSENDQLIFLGWCRKRADEALFKATKQAANDFVEGTKGDLKELFGKTEELSKEASKKVEKGINSFDEMMKNFLKKRS